MSDSPINRQTSKNPDALVGQRFGKLLATRWFREETGTECVGRLMVDCKCDCGNTREVYSGYFVAGKINSCGCANHPYKDQTGQRFGKLLVVREHPSSVSGNRLWLCACDCGGQKTAHASELRSLVSCGCASEIQRLTPRTKKQFCFPRYTNPRDYDYAK